MVNFWFGRWSVVFIVGAAVVGGRWSVFCIFTGRWSVFIFENGRWSVSHDRWSVICGLWSVGGGFVLRLTK